MMKTNFLLLQVRGKPQGSAYTWNTPFFDLQFVNIRTKKGKEFQPMMSNRWCEFLSIYRQENIYTTYPALGEG